MDYLAFIYILRRSYFVLTDSGGVQEEAPSLQKPVLILRSETERNEGIEANVAKLIGTDSTNIINECSRLLSDDDLYKQMQSTKPIYGDGFASKRIVESITNFLNNIRFQK